MLASILAAVALTRLDFLFQDQFQDYFPDFLLSSPSLARSILTVLATSLLTMTAITFSTIMVVFSVYSSQFSPRTLQNFIADRLTQIVLGVFIAGFTYSIITLLLLHENEMGTIALSTLFAIILSLICIGFFIRFIQFISVSIQVNNLIEKINSEIFETYSQRIKDMEDIRDKGMEIKKSSKSNIPNCKKTIIYAHTSGHIQLIDINGLIMLAKKNDILIEADKCIGDYVTESIVLFKVKCMKEEKDDIIDDIKGCFSIGNYRDTAQDLEFGLDKLEEIALRAISPGINDPNTAILCIRNMGNILSKMTEDYMGTLYFYDQDKNLRLILKNKEFKDLIYASFYKILGFSRDQVSILYSILEALLIISGNKQKGKYKALFEFTKYSIDGFNKRLLHPNDISLLNNRLKSIAKNLDIKDSELLLRASDPGIF